LEDKDGKIHPVEISLICWTMLKVSGSKLTKAKYLEGGKKDGWLDKYLDDFLSYLPNKENALQVLMSLINNDKTAILTIDDIIARSGVKKSEIERLLDEFEQSKIIVKQKNSEIIEYRLAHEYLIGRIKKKGWCCRTTN